MRLHLSILALLVLLTGCAAYKELQPEPPVTPAERGYIELKDDKKNFELDKEKKYFIKFPPPAKDHFRLMVITEVKPALHSYLTSQFDGGAGPFTPIVDETERNDSVSVYAVDRRSSMYFWVIDTVKQDLQLALRYRYVPEWRYTFETRYAEFKEILANNLVDRSTYNAIDRNFSFENFNFTRELSRLDERNSHLKAMNEELRRLASVFPADIAVSRDTAYEQYADLKSHVMDELQFQENYGTALTLFKKERETRGDMAKFLDAVPYFTTVVGQQDRFPQGILEKARDALTGRLDEITPFYEARLRAKNNLDPITPAPAPGAVAELYKACGQSMPRSVDALLRFVQRFNVESHGLDAVNGEFSKLESSFRKNIASPTPGFLEDQLAGAGTIKAQIPEPLSGRFEKYGNYPAAVQMTDELSKASRKASDMQTLYTAAVHTSADIGSHSWSQAESGLRQMADDRTFADGTALFEQRGALVKRFETQLFTGVKLASEQRVDAFAQAHESTYDNVPMLYQDSVFTPVYQLTFSSIGPTDLMNKRKQIDDYLDNIKYIRFPETSIKNIYRDFLRNISDHGVEKARAITDHGKFYRGTDKQVRAIIEECNVNSAKGILKPREYRKLYALPVTSNKGGQNEYMFRIRLNIPSEAQFPVYDINIKLPPEVAQKAGTERWYDEITINKKPIKNEGRFRITAPLPANNFESLITPVQMDKEGNNILEVKFRYPGFKVFEVSAMAQVPIIRKN